MVKRLTLNIVIDLEDERLANTLYKALLPESKVKLRGIETKLIINGASLKIIIEAPDYSSLRAVSNALLRLSDTVLRMVKSLR